MCLQRELLWFLLIIFISKLENVWGNEVTGCGGFIKSDVPIDHSKIKLKLYTKQGALKETTDCSPSNGYYFLPLYDKGDYILRVAAPLGWNFQPKELQIPFDGVTDDCSRNLDINFVFKGFGITGKVLLGDKGAGKVKISLQAIGSNDSKFTTTTNANGVFIFSPIIPGKYIIKAFHSKWYFAKSEHTIVVAGENVVLPDDYFVLTGFEINGRIKAFNHLISQASMALFNLVGTKVFKCSNTLNEISQLEQKVDASYESKAVCSISISTDGSYVFENVPHGRYLLQPFLNNSQLKLHWQPEYLNIDVINDALDVSDFWIKAFSIRGQVLTAVDHGSPIMGAFVKLNGKQMAITDAKGFFTLSEITTTGVYTLQVSAPHLQFEEQQIQLQWDSQLPVITPSHYEVCGEVETQGAYTVDISQVDRDDEAFHTTITNTPQDETNAWCTYLPPGRYILKILNPPKSAKIKGNQFYPLQHLIEVKSEPIGGIQFKQLRATVTGRLKCLPDAIPSTCLKAEVTLNHLDATGQIVGHKQTTKAENGEYSFKNVLCGAYEISIPRSKLCFENTRLLLSVNSDTVRATDIVQHGYEVDIRSSHRAMMKYTHLSTGTTNTLKLLAGVNILCVPKSGVYRIHLEGCHSYDTNNLPATFDSMAADSIIINAMAHKVGISILSKDYLQSETIQLLVEFIRENNTSIISTADTSQLNGQHNYRFDIYLKPNQIVRVTPKSDVLLFDPIDKEVVGGDDCVSNLFTFVASYGLILQGKVIPSLENAKITLNFPQNSNLNTRTTTTSSKGEFKFPPIPSDVVYELKAEKASYVFSEFNHTSNTFTVYKLGEIIVRVSDDAGKELSGVLISLSGSESSNRKNLITDNNGIINFQSLSPSKYFLKPILKEYIFEPNSKIIDLADGETIHVEMRGHRVAYSVFGSVTSLSDKPFIGVGVEATADESCEFHQEEGTTDSNGDYRLRGLQPGCTYNIVLKESSRAAQYIERTLPASRKIKIDHDDIHNVDLVGINQVMFTDIIVSIVASTNDLYKTLRLIMYRKREADKPVYSQQVESPLDLKDIYNRGVVMVLPRVPLDKKTVYVLELQSSLSTSMYTYKLPSKQFIPTVGTIFLELEFTPEVRLAEPELNHGSIAALIIVVILAAAFFKQELTERLLKNIWLSINRLLLRFTQKSKFNGRNNSNKMDVINQKEIEQMAEQINNIKKRKSKRT